MAFTSLVLGAFSVAASSTLVQAAAAATKTVSFGAAKPSNAVTVPANFVGFGFETAFLNQYDNAFSNGLIESVASRMAAPPVIRIGGTSGDHVHYDPSQKQNTTCVGTSDCPNGSGASFILGPSYFDGFKSFKSAHMSFQAPLGRPLNVSNTLDYVNMAYKNLGADRLEAIAIGNEVVATNYEATAADYINAAHTLEANITKALGLNSSSDVIFEVLDVASGQVAAQSPWTLPQAFQQGLNNNGLVKIAAEHWYQDDTGFDVQKDLMNHSTIVNQFQPYNLSLQYLKGNTKIPLVFSEVGSSLGGDYQYAASFGACMWSVDFQLFGMSQGVARIDMSGRPAATHSLWVPISGEDGNPGPAVRANYPAQHFIAEFIGRSASTAVVEMDLGSDVLTAYGAYNGTSGSLARVALVNLNAWSRSNGTRGSQAFAVAVPSGTNSVKVARLQAPAGVTALGYDEGPAQNVTFAGQQWAYTLNSNGNPTPTTQTLETTAVTSGKAIITLEDSEAVIVYV